MGEEKTYTEQYAKLLQYLAELRRMEQKQYVNAARIERIMENIPSLEKATRKNPEVRDEIFLLAKRLLRTPTVAGHFRYTQIAERTLDLLEGKYEE